MLTKLPFPVLRRTATLLAVLSAAAMIQACCTKKIRIPPRVDGVHITLDNAKRGYYHLLVNFEGCELCDQDKEAADAIIENAEELFALRVDERLTNEQYNGYVERIQAKLLIARKTCNTYAIPDTGAELPGTTTKYTKSQKARDVSLRIQEARENSNEVLAEAKQAANES